jgi:hypothetical protein
MVRQSPLASPAMTWRDKVTARPPLTPTGGPRETAEHGGLGAGGRYISFPLDLLWFRRPRGS